VQAIVPNLPSVPVQMLILKGRRIYGMADDFFDYATVLPPYRYADQEALLAALDAQVIGPAEAMAAEIVRRRADRRAS
jgi:hypothetical protein